MIKGQVLIDYLEKIHKYNKNDWFILFTKSFRPIIFCGDNLFIGTHKVILLNPKPNIVFHTNQHGHVDIKRL